MSIISAYKTDNSDLLYKRYALLAASYLENPEEANSPTADVPLENLFRLLEMYRYDAFSDESRTGILAVESTSSHVVTDHIEEAWHTNIEKALKKAKAEAFQQETKEAAIEDLESTLRSLSVSDGIKADNQQRAMKFFNKFLAELE